MRSHKVAGATVFSAGREPRHSRSGCRSWWLHTTIHFAALLATAALLVRDASAQLPTAAETRLLLDGMSVGDEFGGWIDSVGDLDGDGADDLIVGCPGGDIAGPNFGVVHVYSGRTGAVLSVIPGTAAEEPVSVCGAGDTDGDGVPDYLVGFPFGGPGSPGPGESRGFIPARTAPCSEPSAAERANNQLRDFRARASAT